MLFRSLAVDLAALIALKYLPKESLIEQTHCGAGAGVQELEEFIVGRGQAKRKELEKLRKQGQMRRGRLEEALG